MILRYPKKPLPLRKLDAAIPRLNPQFPSLHLMNRDVKTAQQGYTDEVKADYYLDHLAHMNTILRDVYLHSNSKNFQMDSLIIANYAIFLVDAKHFKGTLTFNTKLR